MLNLRPKFIFYFEGCHKNYRQNSARHRKLAKSVQRSGNHEKARSSPYYKAVSGKNIANSSMILLKRKKF